MVEMKNTTEFVEKEEKTKTTQQKRKNKSTEWKVSQEKGMASKLRFDSNGFIPKGSGRKTNICSTQNQVYSWHSGEMRSQKVL